jgi:hypothetical protein
MKKPDRSGKGGHIGCSEGRLFNIFIIPYSTYYSTYYFLGYNYNQYKEYIPDSFSQV